ncbi:hypothetical protein [Aquidulcibacter sp.]|jgi:hypothetical protein|uniref:hypothetical protein n=1 Tax=Aquidulcibacter sp. TaxID=2052990 RepID=UPI0028B17E6A|nr:hypothetical protein [Aquidulcibacter sp.]
MKVDPPLFPQSLGQTPTPARPSTDATEARKAFAALLSAANQRSNLPGAPSAETPSARPNSAANSTSSLKAEEPATQAGLARPGRVIDIRV